MFINLSKITEKFYTDYQRWWKAVVTEPQMLEIMLQVGSFLRALHMKGFKFYVFHMDQKNETIHAALIYCCGRLMGHAVKDEFRHKTVEPMIIANTCYKKIIWEDLLLVERMKNEKMDSNTEQR